MKPSQQEQAAFWQGMAEALNAGKTVVQCLQEVRSTLSGSAFESAAQSLIVAVEGGKTLSQALREQPDVFDKQVVECMASGETAGMLQPATAMIAQVIQTGDVGKFQATGWPLSSQAIEYVSQLLDQALKARASDIHLDQYEGGRCQARLRIDGVLQEVPPPAEGLMPKVIDYVKAMGAMNLAEKRMPQDGECSGRNYHLHICVVPAYYGERAVMRILNMEPQGILLGLDKVGLSDRDLPIVRRLCELPAGIVIVNGPTGSGKTTLLYSMLMEANQPGQCVMTVEDPVEYAFAGMAQIQIRPQIGLTFTKVIRSILRQDPDVIMVGEIRDLETVQLCAQCALTGHLVLTTLHANTSPGAIQRLLDMGLEPFLVSGALGATISMRVMRLLCPKCKKPAPIPWHSLPPEAVEFLKARKDAQFYAPVGCEHCGGGHGYRGRTGIYEILVMDDTLRQLVTDNAGVAAVRKAAIQGGMRTLLMDGLEKASRGITSIEEVLRVAPMTTSS